ncbi:hypothetical protein BESB_045060 [Besnoitia besnoiti]|uniref:Uncharacterized protein n=1 Tax=Besnoitia besnoiti TaxID=94643 RepID=A0A2A9MGM2_BESBE|nr:hypothetical protein BESB_045060 [Besnoitia besnoiti]PFH36314.1 hypothetical protein BESB_045060 [Besnoitia besnoiti]
MWGSRRRHPARAAPELERDFEKLLPSVSRATARRAGRTASPAAPYHAGRTQATSVESPPLEFRAKGSRGLDQSETPPCSSNASPTASGCWSAARQSEDAQVEKPQGLSDVVPIASPTESLRCSVRRGGPRAPRCHANPTEPRGSSGAHVPRPAPETPPDFFHEAELAECLSEKCVSPAAHGRLRRHLLQKLCAKGQAEGDTETGAEGAANEFADVKELQRENRLMKVWIACMELLPYPKVCDDRKLTQQLLALEADKWFLNRQVSEETLAIRRLQTEKQQLWISLLRAQTARHRKASAEETAQEVAATEARLQRSYAETEKKREAEHACEVAQLQEAIVEVERRLQSAEEARTRMALHVSRQEEQVLDAEKERREARAAIESLEKTVEELKHQLRTAQQDQVKLKQEAQRAAADVAEAQKLREEVKQLKMKLEEETTRRTQAEKDAGRQLAAARQEIDALKDRCEGEQTRTRELEAELQTLFAAGATPALSRARSLDNDLDDVLKGHGGNFSMSRRRYLEQFLKMKKAGDAALLKATLVAHRAGIAPRVMSHERHMLNRKAAAGTAKERRGALAESPVVTAKQTPPPNGTDLAAQTQQTA